MALARMFAAFDQAWGDSSLANGFARWADAALAAAAGKRESDELRERLRSGWKKVLMGRWRASWCRWCEMVAEKRMVFLFDFGRISTCWEWWVAAAARLPLRIVLRQAAKLASRLVKDRQRACAARTRRGAQRRLRVKQTR